METLYSAIGPSARTVRMFIAEKNIDIAQQEVNILGGDNLTEEFLQLNPGKQLQWLDTQMEGGDYICGDRFSLADIQLWCFLDFGADIRHRLPKNCTTLLDWYHRIAKRPSVAASAHPAEAGQG